MKNIPMRRTISTIIFLLYSLLVHGQVSGVYHGYRVDTNKAGLKIREGMYKDGRMVGEWIFYRNGVDTSSTRKWVSYRRFYLKLYADTPNFVDREGVMEQYDENGELKSRPTGKWKSYYFKDGKRHLLKELYYKEGKLHGDYLHNEVAFNGRIRGQYKDSLRTGQWTYSDMESDKLYATEHYEKGKLQGSYEYYNRNTGKLQTQGSYEKGMRNGLWSEFDSTTGICLKKEYYKAGVLHGDFVRYDSRGRMLESGRYEQGIKTGDWKYYDELTGGVTTSNFSGVAAGSSMPGSAGWDDTVYYHKNLMPGADKAIASYFRPPVTRIDEEHYRTSYYRMNGRLHLVAEGLPGKVNDIYSLEIGKAIWDGHVIFYDTLGQKKSEGSFIKGEKLGEWIVYRPGGTNIEYTNTIKPDGDLYLKSYRKNPNIVVNEGRWEKIIKNGKETMMFKGKWFSRYRNGDSQKVCYYNNKGQLHGRFVIYDSATRSIKEEGTYANGVEEGTFLYYNPQTGKPVKIKNYKSGGLHGQYALFDSASGNKILEGALEDGMMTGKWLNYNAQTGRITTIRNYTRDKKDGVQWQYDADGQVLARENYENGRITGTNEYYYPGGTRLKAKLVYKIRTEIGEITVYDSLSGKKNVVGSFLGDHRVGKWTWYYEGTDKIWYTEHYTNNLQDGEMQVYAQNGTLIEKSLYEKGERVKIIINHENTEKKWIEFRYVNDSLVELTSYYVSGQMKRHHYLDDNNIAVTKCFDEAGEEIPFTPIQANPEFPGDVMTYIGNNLHYPEEARDMRLEGKVVVSFIVNEDGTLSDVYVQQGFDARCDAEAVRLVTAMPLWQPAQIDGIPFKMTQSLPIVFWLPEQQSDME